jgi:hypothetical protein
MRNKIRTLLREQEQESKKLDRFVAFLLKHFKNRTDVDNVVLQDPYEEVPDEDCPSVFNFGFRITHAELNASGAIDVDAIIYGGYYDYGNTAMYSAVRDLGAESHREEIEQALCTIISKYAKYYNLDPWISLRNLELVTKQ